MLATHRLSSVVLTILLIISNSLASPTVPSSSSGASSTSVDSFSSISNLVITDTICQGERCYNGKKSYFKCTKNRDDGIRERDAANRIIHMEKVWKGKTVIGRSNIRIPYRTDKIEDACHGPSVLYQTMKGLSYLLKAGIGYEGISAKDIMVFTSGQARTPTVVIDNYEKTQVYGSGIASKIQTQMAYDAASAIYIALDHTPIEDNPNLKRTTVEACLAQVKSILCNRPVKPPLRKPVSALIKSWQTRYPESKNALARQKIKPFLRDVFRLLPDDPEQRLTPDQFLERMNKPSLPPSPFIYPIIPIL
ncbi:hypothetical protein BDF22DRAFT_740675 [Syncephalis plumigaleata]|nr:hypothetical protein BDF22DRAFT_740675 [Syncephalis plumigaleata]